MRILVIGGTRGTGREVVQQALERGHHVVALARKPSNVKIQDARLRVAEGDVMKPESLDAAMANVDAVVCARGHKRWLGPTNTLSEGTRRRQQCRPARRVLHALHHSGHSPLLLVRQGTAGAHSEE
jgi:putative NADH-flavin reductase